MLGKKICKKMHKVTIEDFYKFIKKKNNVMIDRKSVRIGNDWSKIDFFNPPPSYIPESKTVWSFYERGEWCTHKGNYRANWSPYIPRNLILKYTYEGDIVLDQMVGSGTTLVECKLLGRNAIGVDINYDAIMVSLDRLNFSIDKLNIPNTIIETYVGDARNLDMISDETIDLIATHPPYSSIVKFSKNRNDDDLSSLGLLDYIRNMSRIAEESFRVLKPGKHCCVLIGDTRKHLHFIPISTKVMISFLNAGFAIRENIIKVQHKTSSELGKWRAKEYSFYKIAHEQLFIFRKPTLDEKISKLKYSLNGFIMDN